MMKASIIRKPKIAKYAFCFKYSFSTFDNLVINSGSGYNDFILEIISWMIYNFGESDGNNWFIRINDPELRIYINDPNNAAIFKLKWC